jgi:hypothetical protein
VLVVLVTVAATVVVSEEDVGDDNPFALQKNA